MGTTVIISVGFGRSYTRYFAIYANVFELV